MKRYGLIILLFISVFYYSIDNAFALQNQDSSRISLDTIINNNTHLFPFYTENTISGLALSGEITLHSDTSLVRIILIDNNYNEYLIYETYPILAGSRQFSVDETGEETFLLNNIIPYRVTFELINASIYLKEIISSEEDKYKAESQNDRLLQQTLNKIDRINQNIYNLGQKWVAGETSISKLSYQEKKRLFGGSVPNFQGFEYYVGGVFVLPGAKDDLDSRDTQLEYLSLQESQYASEFSWKNRHGEDWVTPVKNQGGCGSCWAFASAAATELLVNLYYNKHLDYDLSEQNLVSCVTGSCSQKGNYVSALNYISNYGLVLEDCFPYADSALACTDACNNPLERIQIENYTTFNSVEDKKKAIIRGAAGFKVTDWPGGSHAIQAVGFKTIEAGDSLFVINSGSESWITFEENHPLIGSTAWLCKNSWGPEWGDYGYVYIINNTMPLYYLYAPVSSMLMDESDIVCADNDGDGYYSWGIGPKPSHCPDSPDEPDGDDSDRCIGPMDDYGNLTYFTPTPDAEDTIVLYGQPVPDLFATGSNIRWYSDKKLLNLVHTGNEFTTGKTEIGDYTYYVTQTLSGCESAANAVSLSIWLEIPRPLGHDTVIMEGEPAILTVTGEQGAIFKWYEDPLLTILLHTGESYETEKTDTGTYTYYVTQTLCLLESAPDTVLLKIAPFIFIPDIAFFNALIDEGVDTNGDRLISNAEAEAVKDMDVSYWDISDMTGIQTFVNLIDLECEGNQLTTLDVSNNTALTTLWCGGNQLTSLDVSGCTNLGTLYCGSNQLTSLDVSNNTALESLYCSDNQLTSLDVSNLDSLRVLECGWNGLTSLDVSGCTNLGTLSCLSNQLTSLDVSGCTALKELQCYHNQLTTLDVSNNTALTSLNCRSNQLTSLDVSNNTALTMLSCGGNQITSLDVSGCTDLHALWCSDNQLTTLDVSNNTALTSLNCRSNQLTSLDVSNNTALTTLRCGWNQLTSLDVSGCTDLHTLECSDNQLTTLDVSNNTALWELKCSNNQLTSLNMSGNTQFFKYLPWDGILVLSNMPTLQQVCVWELPFPPAAASSYVDTTGSPNINFRTECSLGIEEYKPSELLIYPNPTNDVLNIETDKSDQYSIEITSLNGQLIYSNIIEGPTHQIDLSSFQKGLYFIIVRSRDYVRTEKIIKL